MYKFFKSDMYYKTEGV